MTPGQARGRPHQRTRPNRGFRSGASCWRYSVKLTPDPYDPGQMSIEFHTPDELLGAVGTHLGYGDWVEITQARIDGFAEATGDFQWIHVDPERAKHGPFGT